MKGPFLTVAAAFTLAACGGSAAPRTVADPARGLVALNTEDLRLDTIAVAAAREIPLTVQSQPLFGGVYVDGRRARRATDMVVRTAGLTAVSGTKSPKVQCAVRNMTTGQQTPVACPQSAVNSVPPVISFIEVRATADSAYVGVLEAGSRSSKSSCMTLTRTGAGWKVLSTSIIADAKHCGR